VNDTLIARVLDEDLASGDVGLSVSAFEVPGTEVLFDNFVVRDPAFLDAVSSDLSPDSIGENPFIPNCSAWNSIVREQVGEEVCIYGLVHDLVSAQSQTIYFQDRNNPTVDPDLRLLIINAWYPDLREGDCIHTSGTLRENGPTSYLFVNSDQLFIYDNPDDCLAGGNISPLPTEIPESANSPSTSGEDTVTDTGNSEVGEAPADDTPTLFRGPEEKSPGDHRVEVRNETGSTVTIYMFGDMFNYTFNIPNGFHNIYVRPGFYTFSYYSCGGGPDNGSGTFNSNWRWQFWCE
jgi:hypothetical protein